MPYANDLDPTEMVDEAEKVDETEVVNKATTNSEAETVNKAATVYANSNNAEIALDTELPLRTLKVFL